MKDITETEMIERGKYLAEVLQLKHDPREVERWCTAWGNKTDLGLFLTARRIIEGT